MDKFGKIITSANKPYGLHRARKEKYFKGKKIISHRKCSEPIFSYNNFDCYVSATFYVIKTNRTNMKYLTGVLNSKIVAFWLCYKGKRQGNQYQVDKEPLMKIPIPKITLQKQHLVEEIINLVNKILRKKKQNPEVDTKELETQIDQLVYKLYNLTSEEIEIVESEK